MFLTPFLAAFFGCLLALVLAALVKRPRAPVASIPLDRQGAAMADALICKLRERINQAGASPPLRDALYALLAALERPPLTFRPAG